MADAAPAFAPLTAALIRRAPVIDAVESIAADAPKASWRDDLRLFAITWAAGFVFFLAFLA